MAELPTFARPGVPQPNVAPAPQQVPAPRPQGASGVDWGAALKAPLSPAVQTAMNKPREAFAGPQVDWAAATKAPYAPETQAAMDHPEGAFAAPAAPPQPAAPAPVAASPQQTAMNSAQINTGESNILDQIGGFLESLFAQRQAPAGMQWDSLQGWVPTQKGPTNAA